MIFSRKRLNLSLLFALIIGAAAAFAQQASFSLVQPRAVIEGRNFSLTFRLTDGDANPPAAPELENCRLLYGPSTSTMHSAQIINGRMSSTTSIDYTYTYKALKAGSVSVPAISVTCEGRTLQSRPATFNILPSDEPASSSADPGRSQGGRRPSADDPRSHTPGRVSADDLLVRVSFSKSKVYEQEPVVATIKVYTIYSISSFQVTTQPAFEGFLCEELPVSLEMDMEHYNGRNYHTAVLKRLLLYPQKSGRLTVNSGKYDVTIEQQEEVNMGFFRTYRPIERDVTTTSNAASLTVVPLPEPKPEGFTGAVGHFSATTRLEPELLKTNEAATYSYVIKGTGNIKYLTAPKIEFPHGIDAYTPKNDIDVRVVGANMAGTFSTDITIVPQEVGSFSIPGIPFVFFNPDNGEYVSLPTQNFDIKVARGASVSTSAAPRQTDINAGGIDDILHIHASRPDSGRKEITYTFTSGLYWFAYILLALILIGVVIVYRRQIRLNADVSGRKLARAARVANKRLKEARTFMERHENEKFYASLAKALWGYISDKLSIAPSQLMRDNVAEKLEAHGLSADHTAEVLEVLDHCEMARFTPVHSDSEVAELYKKASDAIRHIEDTKKR